MSSDLPEEAIAFVGRMYDAARAGQVDVFQQALPAGLPPNLTNEKGDTLVCTYSQKAIQRMIFAWRYGLLTHLQLMLASYHGHAELVQLLLQHGADPNRVNDRGQSILAGAVFKGEDAVIEVRVLSQRVDVGKLTYIIGTSRRRSRSRKWCS